MSGEYAGPATEVTGIELTQRALSYKLVIGAASLLRLRSSSLPLRRSLQTTVRETTLSSLSTTIKRV